ncbi:MAG: hypothetical protein ACK5VX_13975 [Akkermansiaceae bacterium]
MNATREKTRLWLLILVGVVATLLGQTHAREIFAPSPHESGIFAEQTQASTGENYDACQYDTLDSLLAANGADELITVRSYTNALGKEGISNSGAMRADSWVTLPGQIPTRSGHLQIEKILEIQPGRGSHYLDFQVPASNLRIPANGPTTSGGALQFQLNNPVPINPSTFLRPPGRPGG